MLHAKQLYKVNYDKAKIENRRPNCTSKCDNRMVSESIITKHVVSTTIFI